MTEYQCTILKWLGGDTVKVQVDLGIFGIMVQRTCRISGINAPSLYSKDPWQKEKAQRALEAARNLLPVGTKAKVVQATAREEDRYGRWLVYLLLPNGRDFGMVMIELGQAAACSVTEVCNGRD